MEKITTQIAIVASPWYSNLASAFEFAKRFAHLHPNFHVSFIIPIFEYLPSAFKANLETETLPTNLNFILLPPITKDDLPSGVKTHLQKKLTLIKSLPHIHEFLKSLASKTHLSALVLDLFALEVLDFAKELNTLSFVYISTSAMALSVFYHLPTLHESISCDFKDFSEPIQIPGCVQIHGRDLPEPVQSRSSPTYKPFLEMTKRFHSVDGFLVNSFLEMEEGTVKAFTEQRGNPLVYLVGPVAETKHSTSKEEEYSNSNCLRWLEKQPSKSVLYICFGAGVTLSKYQTNELALGLELSGKKFLWVMRAPSDSVRVVFDHGNEDPLQFLPKGFLERTKKQGLVVPLWAPQVPILRHRSIGGFLSHCGWNSVIESVQHGVPLIAWPLFAEQRLNATSITNGLKVALWPKVNEDGIVKEEIAKVIKRLMEDEEGKEIYKRMESLKDAAANAVKDDGSSTKAMSQVALRWKNFSGK